MADKNTPKSAQVHKQILNTRTRLRKLQTKYKEIKVEEDLKKYKPIALGLMDAFNGADIPTSRKDVASMLRDLIRKAGGRDAVLGKSTDAANHQDSNG